MENVKMAEQSKAAEKKNDTAGRQGMTPERAEELGLDPSVYGGK